MNTENYKASEGSYVISEDVVASIASSAALEVSGVAGMATRPADFKGILGSGSGRSVKVQNNEYETILDVYINIQTGARIPEVGAEVQRNVKTAVQSMTGKPVNKVNVYIAGLAIDEEETESL